MDQDARNEEANRIPIQHFHKIETLPTKFLLLIVRSAPSKEVSKAPVGEEKELLRVLECAEEEQQKFRSSQKDLVDVLIEKESGTSDRRMSPPEKDLLASGKEELCDNVVAEKSDDTVVKESLKLSKKEESAKGVVKNRKRSATKLNVEQKGADETKKDIKTFEWIG